MPSSSRQFPEAAWSRWFAGARAAGRAEDMLVLADEAPGSDLQLQAYRAAAHRLAQGGQHQFAGEICDKVLASAPGDPDCLALQREIAASPPPVPAHTFPRKIFLFSGHMVDKPDRKPPRFPAEKVPLAAQAIAAQLDALGCSGADLAIASGACGGDLLFAEAVQQRHCRLQIYLPFETDEFLARSVGFAGEMWEQRFAQASRHPQTGMRIMPRELGPPPEGASAYERVNIWMLYAALSGGVERVHFICLWNRQGGDGRGGTRHLHDAVADRGGKVHVLDTRQIFQLEES